MKPAIRKTVCGKLDYAVDFSNWLEDDTLINYSIAVEPDDDLEYYDDWQDGRNVVFWLRGGELGKKYTIAVQVTTAMTRTCCRKIVVEIVDKFGRVLNPC